MIKTLRALSSWNINSHHIAGDWRLSTRDISVTSKHPSPPHSKHPPGAKYLNLQRDLLIDISILRTSTEFMAVGQIWYGSYDVFQLISGLRNMIYCVFNVIRLSFISVSRSCWNTFVMRFVLIFTQINVIIVASLIGVMSCP